MALIALDGGSTPEGYIPRQTADFQRAYNEAHAEIVDPKTGEKPFLNQTDDTIAQQFLGIIAEGVANADNAGENANLMRNPLYATGALLSAIAQINGILRKPGSPTIVQMEIRNNPAIVIPAGYAIGEAEGNLVYETTIDAVIPAEGMVIVPAKCMEKGPNIPENNTIVVVQNPINSHDEARNIGIISVGTNEETDAELRRRQQQSTNATSYRQIEAIRAAVLNIPGVTFCRAYQNRTLDVDDRGIPGKAIACVVVGGDEWQICNAILLRSPETPLFHGNVSRTLRDNQGIPTVVSFSRPVDRPVWIRVELSVVNDERIQVFPSNGPQLIKEAIVNFSNTGHSACEPLGNTGFPPGQDIIRSYLYTPINSIGGAAVRSISLSLDGVTFTESDIAIAWNEIGVIDESRIEVIVI